MGQVRLGGDRTHRGELVGCESNRRDVSRGWKDFDMLDGLSHGGAQNGEGALFHVPQGRGTRHACHLPRIRRSDQQ